MSYQFSVAVAHDTSLFLGSLLEPVGVPGLVGAGNESVGEESVVTEVAQWAELLGD